MILTVPAAMMLTMAAAIFNNNLPELAYSRQQPNHLGRAAASRAESNKAVSF
jgi:hypothetical protein